MSITRKLAAGQLFTLFHLGAIGDLSDRQLLERFASSDGEPAELAFSALVERHGPMVLRVSAALLRDPHDAQDAFQATFMVLLRKSHELWVHDSLGPWLHRVARRVATRAQATARRRREFERRAAESRTALRKPPENDPCAVLHEEIDRLPEWLRALVVLCHLEGQSQELAAKTLSLPIGTVKSRLHRARGLLRGRLSRRGVGFSSALPGVEPRSQPADALHSLPVYQSLVGAAARAGFRRASNSGLISARAIHLFEETIKTMFLTRMRIGVALALLAGCLAAGAVGVFAQNPRRNESAAASARGPGGKSPSGAPTADPGAAPSYIRRSRTMIIERLERELKVADGRLDLTTVNVRSPADPELVRARKTVDSLAQLLSRVDAVLVEAVDEFPTIFDFSNAQTGSRAGAGYSEVAPGARASVPVEPDGAPPIAPGPRYDEHSLGRAAERMEWTRRMHAKGFVSKPQLDREVAQYEALRSRIDADIAQAAERVDWATRMLAKGYVSKQQHDAEILRHYDALKARLQQQAPAVNDELLLKYEQYKAAIQKLPPDSVGEDMPQAGEAKHGSGPDNDTYDYIRRNTELTPPAKAGTQTTPGAPAAKPASDSRRP